jgi:hypothetical protein
MIQTLEHLNLRVIFVTVPTHDTAVQSSPTCLLQCHRTLLNANVVQPLARAVRCWIGFEFIQNFNHATLFNIVGPFNPIVGPFVVDPNIKPGSHMPVLSLFTAVDA